MGDIAMLAPQVFHDSHKVEVTERLLHSLILWETGALLDLELVNLK